MEQSLDCCPAAKPRLHWATLQLALICTLNYGALLYLLPVLFLDLSAHWSLPISYFFWAYSGLLLAAALISPWIGRTIERMGARRVLAISSLLGALLLALLAWLPHPALALLVIVLLGLAKAGAVYESSFAYCYRRVQDAAKVILLITLMAGFASTVFIPLAHALKVNWGWQVCLLVFAVIGPGLSAVLAWALPPDHRLSTSQSQAPTQVSHASNQQAASRALQICFICFALVASAVTANMYSLLSELQMSESLLLLAMMLIGPAQSLARLLFGVLRAWLGNKAASIWALVTQPLAFVCLPLLWWHPAAILLFALAFGLANGSMTMVRAISIADLFGRDGYAARAGRFAAPSGIAAAVAPGLFASLYDLGLALELLLLVGAALAAMMWWQFQRSYELSAAATAVTPVHKS